VEAQLSLSGDLSQGFPSSWWHSRIP
jgi:hypothetical protein